MEASKRNVPFQINTNNEMVTIDSIRQHIIDGNAYRVSDSSFNVPADASLNYAFVTCPDCTYKVKFFIECDNSCNLRVLEDSSWNTNGTLLTAYNFNRTSTNTMDSQLYKDPSMTGKWGAAGTLISSTWAFATNTAGNQGRTAFGGLSDEYSMIFAPSKRYLFNIVNKSASTANLAVKIRITEGTV
jgi:hypothetical protein